MLAYRSLLWFLKVAGVIITQKHKPYLTGALLRKSCKIEKLNSFLIASENLLYFFPHGEPLRPLLCAS